MKRSPFILIISSILIIALPQQSTFAAAKTVKPKSAGRSASSIPNTILSGVTAPKATVGLDGDFYIDIKSSMFYGPKVAGRWPTGVSLKGEAGSDGKDGVTVTKASNVAGPQGDKGEKGEKGDQGERGLTGETGPAGAPGAQGAAGPAGPAGPAGVTGPSGAAGANGPAGTNGTNGAKGDTGATGATGAKGDTGATGAKGDTGATGPAGISLTTYGELPLKNFNSVAGTLDSYSGVGNMLAGGYFVIHIYLWGINANANPSSPTSSGMTPVLSLYASNGAVIKQSNWISGFGTTARAADEKVESFATGVMIIDTVNASSATKINIGVKFAKDTTGPDQTAVYGAYEISQVGALATP